MSFFDSDRYPSHKFKKDIVSNTFMLNILYPFEQKQSRKPRGKNFPINKKNRKKISNIKLIEKTEMKKRIELLRKMTQQLHNYSTKSMPYFAVMNVPLP